MSWKFANIFKIKSCSLSTKLMVLYTLSTLCLLAAMGLFLYPTFIRVLQQLDATHAYHLTAMCFQRVIIALLLSTFGAVILGYVIARNGLSRIHEFSTKMENMTAHSLHERVDPRDWPKELKTLGNKFNSLLDRLESAFIQQSQFSSDIAHELRTPIHNLRGITELALTKEKSIEEYKRILESHQEEYDYLTRLIENLLFLAHAEHGEITLQKTGLVAREEIAKIADYFQAVCDEKEIKLCFEGDAILFADPTLFKRAFTNLLSNAFRYTQNKGEITIEVRAVDRDYVQISVKDTGTGIGEEHLSKVFDRFYRVDPSRSSQSGGVGLGLSLVKSIIDLHQGKIAIESELNRGTTVHVQFPLLAN